MRLLGLSPAAIATPQMRALWEDRATLQAMLDVEAALARAEARCGLFPPAMAGIVVSAADATLYDLDSLADAALRAGTPTIPVVKALTAEVHRRDPAAAAWVHWGATSQDIADTALVLQLRRAVALVQADGERLTAALRQLAVTYADTPMLGRTLLQPGPPITFGLKAAGWLGAVCRSLKRLQAAAAEALCLQFGGAVGTLAALDGAGLAIADALGAELGLPVPDAPWHAYRDRLAAIASAAAILGGTLGKLGRDLSLLAQPEIAEVAELGGAGRGGSSTMPHKRNPVASVVMLATANRLPGLAVALLAGLVGEHERAAGPWQAEAGTHAEIMLCLSGSLAAAVEAIEGLHIEPAAMAANIERLHGLIFAERLMLSLTPTVGRSAAQDLTERLVAEAIASGDHLRDAAARDPTVAQAITDLPALFDPATYNGSASAFIARQLAAAPSPTGRGLWPASRDETPP